MSMIDYKQFWVKKLNEIYNKPRTTCQGCYFYADIICCYLPVDENPEDFEPTCTKDMLLKVILEYM